MTAELMICMYSGMMPPKTELTLDQEKEIVELASQLNQPFVGAKPIGGGSLSSTHYLVIWNRGFPDPNTPLLGVRAEGFGCIEVWRSSQWIKYKDTVGLWAYLATIGVPLLQRHLEGNV
jgi:hypothetical protein